MRNFVAASLLLLASAGYGAPQRQPIIDMHLHAHPLSFYGGAPPPICAGAGVQWMGVDPKEFGLDKLASCPRTISAPATDKAVMELSLQAMQRHNIWAVASGPLVQVTQWKTAAPDRIIPAISFLTGEEAPDPASAAKFRQLFKDGQFAVFAEIGAQYRGMSPDDPSLEPFYALAEELDIPVGIHMGFGPPGGPYWADAKYRARLGDPLLLEDLLLRHPKMRVYVMHAGSPLTDQMIALLFSHPQVYVDISGDNWGQPPAEFHRNLKRLVEAGYGKRIMFGSDQMVWPEAIDLAVASIESADYLTPAQKRDIFYNNAARFLRLTPELIRRHHGK